MEPSRDSMKYRSSKAGFFKELQKLDKSFDRDSMVSFDQAQKDSSPLKDSSAIIVCAKNTSLTKKEKKSKRNLIQSDRFISNTYEESKCSTKDSAAKESGEWAADKESSISRFFSCMRLAFCGRQVA